MDTNSWMRLTGESPRYRLDQELRTADRFAAKDCGWVEQMRPFVAQLSRPGELVLDPFCGFGTTLLAAALEGRRGLGFEVDIDRIASMRKRLQAHAIADAELNLGSIDEHPRELPTVDLCLTSIPYFGCNWTAPSSDPAQLYTSSDYSSYLRRIGDIFHRVHGALADGRYCVAMAENMTLDGRMVPLAWDVARLLSDRFELLEERVLLYDKPASALAPLTLQSNRAHEYALVFRKTRVVADIEQTAALLREFAAEGFAFAVYGSFADWLQGGRSPPPGDADVLVTPDETVVNALLAVLVSRGFSLTSWGEPVTLPLRLDAFRGRHYFRARRLDRTGQRLQLDITFEVDAVTAERKRSALVWIAGIPVLGHGDIHSEASVSLQPRV